MNTHDIDEIFTLLENPTRRRILGLLSMETHYPLQIARELGISQQAIGKHIKILESHGLIRSFEEPSSMGGPPRKSYVPTQRISMRVDLGPGMFQTYYIEKRQEMRPSDDREKLQSPGRAGSQEGKERIGSTGKGQGTRGKTGEAEGKDHTARNDHQRLRSISKSIQELNHELDRLEKQRMSLINKRADLMQEGRNIVMRSIPGYMERKLIYYLLERGPTSIEDISEIFDRRIKLLREVQRDIEEEHGLRWLFRH